MPAQLASPVAGDLEVRGEIYLPHQAFHALNEALLADGKEALINPRNACAGLMKRKDAASLTGLGIAAFVYHIVDELLDPATKKLVPTTQSERLAWLGQCGLPVYHGKYLVSEDSNAVLQWCEDTGEQRQDLGYDIDGMVIKLDDTRYYGELGSTSHHPRWGIAYKFPPAEQTTIIRAVTVQVGKSGKLTPVAELDPVFLAGTTVSRATLHNFSEVGNKDVTSATLCALSKLVILFRKLLQQFLTNA